MRGVLCILTCAGIVLVSSESSAPFVPAEDVHAYAIAGRSNSLGNTAGTADTVVNQLPEMVPTFETKGPLCLQGDSGNSCEMVIVDPRFYLLLANVCKDLPVAANLHVAIGDIAIDGSI